MVFINTLLSSTLLLCTNRSKERFIDMVLLLWISRVRCHRTVKRCSASSLTPWGRKIQSKPSDWLHFPLLLLNILEDAGRKLKMCEQTVFQHVYSAGVLTLSLCKSAWQMMSSQMDADGAKQ